MNFIDCYLQGLSVDGLAEQHFDELSLYELYCDSQMSVATSERERKSPHTRSSSQWKHPLQHGKVVLLPVQSDFQLACQQHINPKTGLSHRTFSLLFRRTLYTIPSVHLRTELIQKLNKINRELHDLYFVVSVNSGYVLLKTYPIYGLQEEQLADVAFLQAERERAQDIMKSYLHRILRITNSEALLADGTEQPDSSLAYLLEFLSTPKESLEESNCDVTDFPHFKQLVEGMALNKPEKVQPLAGCTTSSAHVFSQIHIYNSSKLRWPAFDCGGFSTVRKDQVEFEYIEYNAPRPDNIESTYSRKKAQNAECLQKATLVRKQPLRGYEYKSRREKMVLELLAGQSCPYLMSFYETSQEQRYRRAIFSQFCHYKSLNHYIYFFNLSMSLSSKLRILREVMLGLWFLKTKKISHLDIKPDNILITKGLQCKISDFGEAHHSTISDYKVTGYTIPYAAPELLDINPPPLFSPQMDIFSFGMMVLEILCEGCPVQTKKYNVKLEISRAYRSRNYLHLIRMQPEKMRKVGPRDVVDIARQLGMRCVLPDPQNRPSHEQIIVVLRKLIDYLERLL